jgi:hypothetical protein
MAAERYVSEQEMLLLLRHAYAQPPEEQLMWHLAQRMSDPVQPINKEGKRRFHPLLLILLVLICAAAGALVYLAHMRL